MWSFFSPEQYMPHAVCFAEDPRLIVTHVGADAVIALSYFSIPLAILYFVRERRGLEFRWIANLFILFIFWCGVTHVADLVTIWYPAYGVQATTKIITAVASVLTASVVWMYMPQALALPSPADLREVNNSLEQEITVRRQAEEQLREARDQLARRVEERTTELRQATQRLSEQTRFLNSIIRYAGSAIWVKDIENRYLLVNEEWSKTSGIPTDQAMGASDAELFPEEIAEVYLRNDRRVIATRQSITEEEPVPDNSPGLHVVSTKFPVLNETGQIIAVGGIATDVTDMKRIQNELSELNAQLRQEVEMRQAAQAEQELYAHQLEIVNEELDTFAHTASHDLKEPLRGISHYATFALEDYGDQLPEGAVTRLTDIRNIATRLQSMIDSLYRVARAGRDWNPEVEVDIEECARAAAETLSSFMDANNAQIEIDKGLPRLRADRDQLTQLFLNLISNGIKYNDADEKRLGVGWFGKMADLPESDRLEDSDADTGPVIYVDDNGNGIPDDANEAVFTVFHRLGSGGQDSNSHGIGLSIANRIVSRHGGRIWVRARAEGGSRFYFTLGSGQDLA